MQSLQDLQLLELHRLLLGLWVNCVCGSPSLNLRGLRDLYGLYHLIIHQFEMNEMGKWKKPLSAAVYLNAFKVLFKWQSWWKKMPVPAAVPHWFKPDNCLLLQRKCYPGFHRLITKLTTHTHKILSFPCIILDLADHNNCCNSTPSTKQAVLELQESLCVFVCAC